MGADTPLEEMRQMFNCNHFICSQANGHGAILGDTAFRLAGAEAPGVHEKGAVWVSGLRAPTNAQLTSGCEAAALAGLAFVKVQLKSTLAGCARLCETLHLGGAARACGLDVIPWQLGGWALALLTQDYEGRPQDVTIVPWAGHVSLLETCVNFLSNKTTSSTANLEAVIGAGRANTWKELTKIRDHTAVEIALETGVQRLRRRLLDRDAVDADADAAAPRVDDAERAAVPRTTSFYTSPSLLHLSGLNVVDPVVNKARAGPQTPPPPRTPPQTSPPDAANETTSSSGDDAIGSFVKVAQPPPPSAPATLPTDDDDDARARTPTLKSMHMANFYYRDAVPAETVAKNKSFTFPPHENAEDASRRSNSVGSNSEGNFF